MGSEMCIRDSPDFVSTRQLGPAWERVPGGGDRVLLCPANAVGSQQRTVFQYLVIARIRVFSGLWCAGDVQRDDCAFVNEYLAGTQSKFAHVLVLHNELLPLSDGDLSAQWYRLGFVGNVYLCGADLGSVQRTSPSAGSAAGDALANVGMVVRWIRRCGRGRQFVGKPLGFPYGTA